MSGFTLFNLITSIGRLALDSEDQQAYLDKLGDLGNAVDELALEFDDAMHGIDQLVDAGWLSARHRAQAEQIGVALGRIEGEWTVADLNGDSWRRVRRLATKFFIIADHEGVDLS